MRFQDRNLPARSAGEFQLRIHHTRLDQVQCSSDAWKVVRLCQVVLICPHWLRASPLRWANRATEIGICIGNCFLPTRSV